MYRAPCARLTRFMMPNTSVSPAAIRKSVTPNWTPLRACSTASSRVSPLPLHAAVLRVGILVVLEDGLLDLHLELAARALHGFQEIEVLDREVVDVVRVLPARRRIVGLPHRGDHALLILEVALHRLDRGVDEIDAVVALRAVER